MSRFGKFLLLFGLCVLATGCHSIKTKSNNRDEQVAVWQRFIEEVSDNHQGYANLQSSTSTIGHRLTGTSNGAQAEEDVYRLFSSYGLQTDYFPFPVTTWLRQSLSLLVNGQSVAAATLAFSPEHVKTTATLIDAGWGYKHEFEALGNKARGHFVLVTLAANKDFSKRYGRNPHRTEKLNFAEAAGAVGVVFVNGTEGNVLMTGTSSMAGTLKDIPSLSIGKENGATLRQRLQAGEKLTVDLSMKNKTINATARNVIATLPGSDKADEWIIVCGHLDSWDLATGAIDNGVGSYGLVDIARALIANGAKPRRTIKFICFMGEEFGLLGSNALRDHWKQSGELKNVRGLINLDMHTNTSGVSCGGFSKMQPVLQEIAESIHGVSSEFSEEVKIGKPGLYSDHLPFMLEGVTVVKMTGRISNDKAFSFYHSNGDSFDLVPEGDMERTAKHVGLMLWQLADWEGELPTQLASQTEVIRFFEKHNLKQPLVNLNSWPWSR